MDFSFFFVCCFVFFFFFFFFFKQKTAYEIRLSLVGSEMCIRDSGPAMARFSCRPIHSRVANPVWVASGMEESCSRHAWNVLPAGRPACLRRAVRVAWSRPRINLAHY